jgi:hypothetical protein
MTDDVLLEHHDISLLGLQVQMAQQRRTVVDREAIVD